MTIAFTVGTDVPSGARVLGVPVFQGRKLSRVSTADVDVDLAYLKERDFDGKVGQACPVPAEGLTVVAVGVGKADEVTAETLRKAAAALVKAAWRDSSVATTLLDVAPSSLDPSAAAQAVVEGAGLAAYRFTTYKADAKPCRIRRLRVVGGRELKPGVDRGSRIVAAVGLARDLVNEPAGVKTPRRLAEVATEIAEREGLEVNVLDEVAIEAEGLGGLRGVSLGSDEPPRLIELVYEPQGGGATKTIALVGKGITFDSGGLSIKTAEGMETMKTDMSGAAAVLATMSLLPALAPDVKVIGIVPTTENMPSGTAIKPGDVLKIRNGKTVEVLNTDAEGRLVLADGLSLAVESGADVIVDVATLTGACMVALGKSIAGLMANDDELAEDVEAAAERAGEDVWRLPLPRRYRKDIDSDVADIKNIGSGRYGGALTAGLFLEEFVGDVSWAHLDIAGPARSDDNDGYLTKGGTGFGVRTLVELLTRY